MNILLFILYVLLSSSGLVLFKLGANSPSIQIHLLNFNLLFSIKSIIGILCYGFSFILWLIIISRMNLTVAMPLSIAIVNTLVVILSCLLLKEKITLTQGVGIFIVIIGVCIMSWGRK
ncbi:MAG: EamA family transporter [Bacilli bacterium]|nr:EamA family transporter [Bacilli bacterium]